MSSSSILWVRSGQRPPAVPDEQLFGKFQGILNKITVRNFQSLVEQALELEIDTVCKMEGCVERLHKAAIFAGLKLQGPNFAGVFANLAKVLSPIQVSNGEMAANFRGALLTRCQQEFERTDFKELKRFLQSTVMSDAERKELEEMLDKAHRQSRANVLFIGELFLVKMLSETILHESIVRLLSSSSDGEALECAAVLMTFTGKRLDHPQAKGRIDKYMLRIEDIIAKGKIPPRVKFLLQDVQELRANSWISQRLWQKTLTGDNVEP